MYGRYIIERESPYTAKEKPDAGCFAGALFSAAAAGPVTSVNKAIQAQDTEQSFVMWLVCFISYLLFLIEIDSTPFLFSVARSIPGESLCLKVLQFLQHPGCLKGHVVDVPSVQVSAFLERKLRDRGKERADLLLHRHKQPNVVPIPARIQQGIEGRVLIRICPQVHDNWPVCHFTYAHGYIPSYAGKVHFPVVPANSVQLATLAKVKNFLAGPFPGLTLKVREKIVAIGMNLPRLAIGFVPGFQLFDNIRHTNCREQRRHPILL